MNVMQALAARRSTKADQLAEPAPRGVELEEILQSAMSAPDHGGVKPWQFFVVDGDAREALGDLFAKAVQAARPDADAEMLAIARGKALRAPLVLVICAKVKPHPKVPGVEQLLTVAMGAENILIAAQAKGYGAVLVTGPNAYSPIVKQAFGLGAEDHIVGFVHLGTPVGEGLPKDRPVATAFTTVWPE